MRFSVSLMVLVMCATQARSADLYVAPGGNDANPGTADRPVATLGQAVALHRAARADKPGRVILRGGSYFDVSVELTGEESGLTIEAAPGEKPVLYGGVPVGNWQKDGEHLFSAKLPEGRSWQPRILVVNDQLAQRARWPEKGTLTHLSTFDVRWMSTTGGGWQRKPTPEELTTLRYRGEDIPETLDVRNAEITVYHMWDESCVGIEANAIARDVLILSPEPGHPPGAFGVKKYVLWNIREGLTRPGQWYHDRPNNRIVYWPRQGEDMSSAQALVPTQTTILRLRGTDQQPIRNVTVRGVGFSVTTVPLVAGGFAAARYDGAISLAQAQDCAFVDLTVRHVAGQGINATRNCIATRVENCEVFECGAGGIYVGGTRALITNNHVRGVGRLYPSAVGIYRGGKQCVVSHNEVHDTTYSAINYGGEGNIIEDNLIYDCMKELHDGAAIYMFAARNCILRRNFARDFVDTGGYGASAYYLDERSEGCIVEDNLSVNVNWPSHNHMCGANTIRNNVFIIRGDAKLTFPRSAGFTLEGNVIHATGKIRFEGIDAITTWNKNLLFSGAGRIEGVRLDQYSAKGTVDGVRGDTVVGDPLFIDPAKGDWRYKADSPALKLGLKPIDVSRAGRKKP